jgi:tRNA (guanine37-N1)-methyltransferase
LARIVPGVLGNPVSASIDSFSEGLTGLEAEAYTKPQTWQGLDVPEVLLSGDHSKIEAYRKERSIVRTEKWLEKALNALKSSIGG